MKNYQIYLVGGAVRDQLLNHPYTEHDWVVVGATPQQLLDKGYQQVGRDFPVFLHPESREEYALARAERKVGSGYRGFEVHASPEITLEEDLLRRDLTINAIAQDSEGNLIDPYGGVEDLNNRILRHVSPAFVEDPVRVLRLARFYARYAPYGFTVAPETAALVKQMIQSGELTHLIPERIWAELMKALSEERPDLFFSLLRELRALAVLFPEVDALFGVPQTAKYHPEIDSGTHTLMALAEAAKITDDLPTRFAVLCHDFGKALTPKEEWPSHKRHEIRGVPVTESFCQRLRVPKEFRDIAVKVTEFHLLMHQVFILRPKTILKLFLALDAIRRPINLERFINACMADARGRLHFENRPYPQKEYLNHLLKGITEIDIPPLIATVERSKIPETIHRARLKKLADMIKDYSGA